MKVADIEVGKRYVYGRCSGRTDNPDVVVILAKDKADPQGRTKWNYSTRKHEPVVHTLWGKVLWASRNYKDDVHEQAVSASAVVEPLEAHEARKEAERVKRDAALAEKKSEADAAEAPTQALVDEINAGLGTSFHVTSWPAGANRYLVAVHGTHTDIEQVASVVRQWSERLDEDEALRQETEGMPR